MIARVTAERGRAEVGKVDARGSRSSFVAAIRELEDLGDTLSIVRCLEHVAELRSSRVVRQWHCNSLARPGGCVMSSVHRCGR
jgi:hypothetical protein